MLSVTNDPIMLSVIILNVVMLTVVASRGAVQDQYNKLLICKFYKIFVVFNYSTLMLDPSLAHKY